MMTQAPFRGLDRRDFLKAGLAAGTCLAVAVGGNPVVAGFDPTRVHQPPAKEPVFAPNVFVAIDGEGGVSLTVQRSEMGQGIRTSFAMLLAEELELELDQVKVFQATGDAKYGNQNTDGSRSVRTLFVPMRQAAAAAREMLVQAAANRWQVQAQTCFTRGGVIHHKASKRELRFGDVAADAAKLPLPENPKLKDPKDFKLIGKGRSGIDVPDIIQGKAVYGADVRLPGMVYASIEHVPVVGATLTEMDDSAARAVPGVIDIIKMPSATAPVLFKPLGGVAVIAADTHAAFKARGVLKLKWDVGPNGTFSSDAYQKSLRETASKPGRVVREKGDVAAAFAKGGKQVKRTYYMPLLAHASMEPPAAVARVTDAGCEVWAPVQAPQRTRQVVAGALDLDPSKVTVNVTLLGGGFGRKSKPDFVAEAALLAKQVGKPVCLTWRREDDIRHDYFHSVSLQTMQAALGEDGYPTAWHHHTVFPSIGSTFDPNARSGSDNELGLGFTNQPYAIENIKLEVGEAEAHVRIGWLRAVCNLFHAFAVNRFLDACAKEAGIDALTYRLKLLGEPRDLVFSEADEKSPYKLNTGRLAHVLNLVAEKSGWKEKRPAGVGFGIAAHYSFMSYVAQAVRVRKLDDGSFKVERVDVALDCGQMVNTDSVRAQMEGAVIFGLSLAIKNEITAEAGRVVQSNFHDYPMLRMSETPEIQVHLVKNNHLPTGVGEPGVPPLPPALASALEEAGAPAGDALPLKFV
ncbi:xanthine dehydrogenase family protein molybdopterin-binding subunit [Acanthopleuribacter pedis]|uniref:Xanthine dehydrogenase family protein molybdopterin-binding subunit n=1 Tax=Acanthopleuribacter pedis TaxID=442870 RepID=A0A8J7QI90_9BACT|nr:molybdopterin cofactor-binding domain-containing protein [Acanthopleuribacter pedis]MBO1320810.1 xanthine dehydrogenase family protein molybdopterin-binding subunit [Acanthopleuribacter pedis]